VQTERYGEHKDFSKLKTDLDLLSEILAEEKEKNEKLQK